MADFPSLQAQQGPFVVGLPDDTFNVPRAMSAAQLSLSYNAHLYGVTGDGTTDDGPALNALLSEVPAGSTVFLPPGNHKTSVPILPAENVTLLGSHSPRWAYQGGTPCVIKGTADFSGTAIVHVTGDIDGGRITNLAIDGGLIASGSPDGLRITGLCRDWVVSGVDSSNNPGNGFTCTGSASFPRGVRFTNVSAYNNDGTGFTFTNTTDSIFTDLLAVDNAGDGVYAANPYESSFTDCRAVFNGANGFQIAGDGTSASSDSLGQTTLNNPSTDRNANSGILVAQEGLGPVQVVAPRLRRDGSTIAAATSSAGLKVLGSSGADDAADVLVIGGTCTVGVDDGGAGDESPLYGVRVTNGGRVQLIGGDYWGVTNGFASSGTNDYINAPFCWFYNGNRASKAEDNPTISGRPLYSVTNVSSDRGYNADSTTTAELADVLGTLISDLRAAGIVA